MSVLSREEIWTTSGQPKTASLFVETCRQGDVPIMSLRGNVEGYQCLRDFYVPMVAQDPSENSFAEAVFGDLRYWMRLRDSSFMQPFLEEWGQMADIKRKELAFQAIMKEIKENGRSAFTAAKYLIEEPWKGKTKEVKKTVKKTTEEAFSPFKDDVARMKEEGFLQ